MVASPSVVLVGVNLLGHIARVKTTWIALWIAAMPVVGQEPQPYAPQTDAKTSYAAALNLARGHNKHLWVQISDLSCPLCERLHWFIESHPETSEPLRRDFIMLHPAIGRANIPLFRAWGSPHLQHGVPLILVLDAEGGILALSTVKSLTDASGDFSTKTIADFIKTWSPEAVRQRTEKAQAGIN